MNQDERYLIVIDLDGTLLHNFADWDDLAIDYLKELTKLGHLVVIATGRPFRSSFFVYKEIGLNTPIINYNGALVRHPYDDKFPKTDLRVNRFEIFDIINFIGDNLLNVFCEIGDDIYVKSYTDDIHPYLHVDGGILHEGNLEDTLPDNPNGCILFVKPEMVLKLQEFVEENFPNTLRSRYWGEQEKFDIVEIYNVNVNKGNGLKDTVKYYNINPNNVIVIGDGHNDIEMFNEAKICVAMENSHPALLPYANVITKSNLEHGVYIFLKSFFEKKLAE